uniref:(California timema) hypothetical protein n=1 Tax=Timema californicum TaxID=61474 RepID=A0A7R9J7M8_TIMCA|nr:unnamed protein product [Timema californicum]
MYLVTRLVVTIQGAMAVGRVVLTLVCVCALLWTGSVAQDDEDVVVTTEELEEPVEDVAYTSPTPSGNVYFAEHFDDLSNFKKKWIFSEAKKEGIDDDIAKYDGKWEVESPQKNPLKGDLGLVLKSKAKHAAISSRLDRPFSFVTKPLVVQYEVTLQEGQECGGAYIKLLSLGKQTADLRQFHDKTPYTIMFGPDKCGNDHKLHFIFRHKNPLNGTFTEKHCKKPKERIEEPFKDKLPHLYTLVVRPDNTFTVQLDNKVINEGSLLEDFTPPVNPPAEVDDVEDKKPTDWDEREKIADPDARKPDDWDEDAPATIPDESATRPDGWLEDEPEMIPDPNAEKPDDWDTDMDGEWEAPLILNPRCEGAPGCGPWKSPMINNPNYKGKWRATMIDNPNYKGKWKPRRIPNPDFFEDKFPYKMADIAAVGIELWSMSDNILFDNIIITDDLSVAARWAADTFQIKRQKFDKDGVSQVTLGRYPLGQDDEVDELQAGLVGPLFPVLHGAHLGLRLVLVEESGRGLTRLSFQESLFTRLINYTNEQPWLWAVYVVLVGLPIVLLLVFCCGSSSQEKEDLLQEAEAKKTDAVSPDDEEEGEEEETEGASSSPGASVNSASKSQLEVAEVETQSEEDILPEEDREVASGGGDVPRSPRKRNVPKVE